MLTANLFSVSEHYELYICINESTNTESHTVIHNSNFATKSKLRVRVFL